MYFTVYEVAKEEKLGVLFLRNTRFRDGVSIEVVFAWLP